MKHVTSNIRRFSATAAVLMIAVSLIGTTVFAEEDETVSYDGLERIESSRVAVAFIHPDADFSVFEWVAILEPRVAFRTNWQRDQNRSRSRNVRTSDMDRIKEDVAALFLELFDSWSNQIIGRGVDRQAANRSGGQLIWSNRVTNTSDARRIFRG